MLGACLAIEPIPVMRSTIQREGFHLADQVSDPVFCAPIIEAPFQVYYDFMSGRACLSRYFQDMLKQNKPFRPLAAFLYVDPRQLVLSRCDLIRFFSKDPFLNSDDMLQQFDSLG
jgi:hypothetical protein